MDTQNNNASQGSQNQPNQIAPNHGDKMIMGILSYIGPFVLIPFFTKKDDIFVKFHIKQGLVLLSIQVILWILSSSMMMWSLWPLYRLIHLAIIVLSIIGIINVAQGKEKELPIVGGFSKYFKF
jgi:uncharacterized membrane protein